MVRRLLQNLNLLPSSRKKKTLTAKERNAIKAKNALAKKKASRPKRVSKGGPLVDTRAPQKKRTLLESAANQRRLRTGLKQQRGSGGAKHYYNTKGEKVVYDSRTGRKISQKKAAGVKASKKTFGSVRRHQAPRPVSKRGTVIAERRRPTVRRSTRNKK